MAFAAAAAAAAVLAFLQHKRVHSKPQEPAEDSKQEGEPQELAPKLSTPLASSASQWLASIRSSTSYGELEMLADGDVVYLRCVDRLDDDAVLTALLPRARRLEVHTLRGKPDSVPTSALDPLSVWVVRRRQQELSFTLLSTRNDGRHTLEADPQSPHGVSLGGGGVNRRGRWLITPTGLANVRWPQHMLPYHVLPIHLLDARTVGAVKAAFGKQLQAAAQRMDEEQRARAAAEEHCALLEGSLKQTKDMHTTAMSQLRSQLDSALRARHAAEREAQTAQGQRAEESTRAKAAQNQAAQAAHEAAQQAALVRQLQQQVQGMLAGHSEELRTLHSELQIARETNEVLKRAMGEQVLQLQGELELRDARIVELEEANEKMDAVLQVIQAQLGGDPMQHHHDLHGMGLDPAAEGAEELPVPDLGEDGTPLADAAVEEGNEGQQLARQEGAGEVEGVDDERDRAGAGPGPCTGAGAGAAAQERPLWASVLELHGDLSLTALQESLVISRRSTILGAPGPAPPPDAEVDGTLAPAPVHHLDLSLGDMPAGNLASGSCFASANAMSGLGPQAWPCRMSLDRSSSVGSTDGDILASHPLQGQLTFVENAGEWGSGGGSDEAMCAAVQRLLVAQGAGQEGGSPTGSGCSGSGPGRKEGVGGLQEAGAAAAEVPGLARGGANGSCPGDEPGPNPFAVPGLNIPSMGLGMGVGLGGAAGAANFFGAQPKTALESGVEAVLTLDSLRRRMRELDAERERLSLLSRSLHGALPWRDSATPPQHQAQQPPALPQQQQLPQQVPLQASHVVHPLEQVLGSQASSSRSSTDKLAPMEVQVGVAVEAEEAVEPAGQVVASESASAQASATAGHGDTAAAATPAASAGPSPEEQRDQQPAAESGPAPGEPALAAGTAAKAVVTGVSAAVASRELAAAGAGTASPLPPARLASANAGSNVRRLAAQLFGAQVDSPSKQWSPKAQQQQHQQKLLHDAPAAGDRGAEVEVQAAAAASTPEGMEPAKVGSPAFTKYGSASAVLERGSPSTAAGPVADAAADTGPLGLTVGPKQLLSALSAAPASCSPSTTGAMPAETERSDLEDDTYCQAPTATATDPSPAAPGNKGRSAAGSRRPDINVRTSSLGMSVHDSICNLASTRALPTARPAAEDTGALGVAAATAAAGGGGGAAVAAMGRYVGSQTPSHSRTPSGLPPCLSEEDHLLGVMDAEDVVDDGEVDDSVVKDIDQAPLPLTMLLGGAGLGAAGKGLPISSAHRAFD